MGDRSTRRWCGAVVAAVALLASGCTGPEEPLDLAVRAYPSDVVLGDPSRPEEPSPTFLPPDALPTPQVLLATLPPPPPRDRAAPPSVPPPPPACPAADPLSAPRLVAPSSVLAPPAVATYEYRNVGTVEVAGPNARKSPVPPLSTRSVRDVATASDGTFTYVVESTLGDTVTTTTYRVVPLAPGRSSGGMFVTAIVTKTGDRPAQSFRPTPALELLRFPIEVGARWQSAGADAQAGVTMAYQATVQVKRRVDACGTLLDAQVVRLDGDVAPCADAPAEAGGRSCVPPQPGLVVRGDGRASFVATYLIGTQYGGLTLLEDTVVDSTEGGVGARRSNVATIAREPVPVPAR